MQILLNAAVAIVALVILYTIWGGAHLLARYRMGDRKLGCRGPSSDDWGNAVCCHTGEPCERAETCEQDGHAPCAPEADACRPR